MEDFSCAAVIIAAVIVLVLIARVIFIQAGRKDLPEVKDYIIDDALTHMPQLKTKEAWDRYLGLDYNISVEQQMENLSRLREELTRKGYVTTYSYLKLVTDEIPPSEDEISLMSPVYGWTDLSHAYVRHFLTPGDRANEYRVSMTTAMIHFPEVEKLW